MLARLRLPQQFADYYSDSGSPIPRPFPSASPTIHEPGQGGYEFGLHDAHRICGFMGVSARHQLANCRTNAFSLSHGSAKMTNTVGC
jgi:hypothetical protein